MYTNEQTISSIKTRVLDFGAESIIRIRVCCGFCMNGSGHGRHTQLCPCVERLPEIDAEERHPSDNPTFVPSVATLEDPPDPQRGPNNDTLGKISTSIVCFMWEIVPKAYVNCACAEQQAHITMREL